MLRGLRSVLLAIVFLAVPWIPGIVVAWRSRPRDGAIPPSMGERAAQRLRF